MICPEYRDLMQAFLEGAIDAEQRQRLDEHARECNACREEYERIQLAETALRSSLAPWTSATQAVRMIEAAIARRPELPSREHERPSWWSWRSPAAAAAAIALAVGLLTGYGVSRLHGPAGSLETAVSMPERSPALPIRIAELKGRILVKRSEASIWQELSIASAVRTGDVLQASPGSRLELAFEDGSNLQLAANSQLSFDRFDGGTQLELAVGTMKASLNSPHPPFVVVTPSGRLEALGTEFTVTVE